MSDKNKIERLVDQGTNTEKHGYQPTYGIKGGPPQGGSVVTPPSPSPANPGSGNPASAPSTGKKE